MVEKGELVISIEKKVKTKFIYLDDAGNDKLLLIHWLLLSLACWLMLKKRLCVYNEGLKVDASQEILTMIMTSYYENVRSCKRPTTVHRVFCFWRFTLLFLGLATHYCESWYSHCRSLKAHTTLSYTLCCISLSPFVLYFLYTCAAILKL